MEKPLNCQTGDNLTVASSCSFGIGTSCVLVDGEAIQARFVAVSCFDGVK